MKFLKTLFYSSFFIFGNILYVHENKSENVIYIKSLKEILKDNPSIECMPCFGKVSYDFPAFIEPTYPNKGTFDECFILSIPQGKVQGFLGNVVLRNSVIAEMIWTKNIRTLSSLVMIPDQQVIKISGKVAVIAQNVCESYSHFIHEVLGRLALLEMHNIEYDYLFVPYFEPFMRELLTLWGVDFKKIIYPMKNDVCIQADTLIVPSLIINTDVGFSHVGLHDHPKTSLYVREKLINGALKLGIDSSKFAKKFFISRKDAPKRKILNEDKIIEFLKEKEFESYELSKMSVAEQILLFNNADFIVGEHGTGLTNILFCKKDTFVVEIFQKLIDSSFWWISNLVGLKYIPINSLNEDLSWATNWKLYGKKYHDAWSAQTVIPLDKIEEVIHQYLP